ncbi:ABC transporter G family member 3-like [Carica papaya]|uniref:ABC transporter G family member 3-like n=1 Tax=Carica papaya TaxID=3649 RepID=UPI000B8CD0C4|nr:ABC transporter G family member 3-like [Carica papaya]
MYFVLNFFMCLLVNEGLILVIASFWQDVYRSILTLISVHVIMMLSAGYFRIRSTLLNQCGSTHYLTLHSIPYSIQGLLENEFLGTSFAVGQVRTISGFQAIRSAYDISPDSNSKWENLLVLFLMAVGYRILVFPLLHFRVKNHLSIHRLRCCNHERE